MNPDLYFIGDPPTERDLTGIGRNDLVRGVQDMHRAGAKVMAERDAYLENLTATQKRCTELLEEVRRLKRLHAHNGEAHDALEQQRNDAWTQRDELLQALHDVLQSATPHPVEHPGMWRAWRRAEAVLGIPVEESRTIATADRELEEELLADEKGECST